MSQLTVNHENLESRLTHFEETATEWMARHGVLFLRLSLGVVFLWFGALKFFPGLSPAEDLATRTITTISFGLISPSVALLILAAWECLIGLGLISAGIVIGATVRGGRVVADPEIARMADEKE